MCKEKQEGTSDWDKCHWDSNSALTAVLDSFCILNSLKFPNWAYYLLLRLPAHHKKSLTWVKLSHRTAESQPAYEHVGIFRFKYGQGFSASCLLNLEASCAEKLALILLLHSLKGLERNPPVEMILYNGLLHWLSFIMQMLTFTFCHPDTQTLSLHSTDRQIRRRSDTLQYVLISWT